MTRTFNGPAKPHHPARCTGASAAWGWVVAITIHLVSGLAGPKLSWWWTGLPFGVAELVLGV